MNMEITRNGVIDTALAFTRNSEEESIDVLNLASRLGIMLSRPDNGEEIDGKPELYGGKVYITPVSEDNTEFDYAMIIGAYILFNKSIIELNEEEYEKCTLFGVVTQFPSFNEVGDFTLSELIDLSLKTNVPYPSLKIAFGI